MEPGQGKEREKKSAFLHRQRTKKGGGAAPCPETEEKEKKSTEPKLLIPEGKRAAIAIVLEKRKEIKNTIPLSY